MKPKPATRSSARIARLCSGWLRCSGWLLCSGWATAALLGWNPALAAARELRPTLAVTASVNAVLRIDERTAPTALVLTDTDLRRGFIDVAEPMTLRVTSNSASGIALDVLAIAPLIAAMRIDGLGTEQRLGADGGTLVVRWDRPPRAVDLSLRFRLLLAPNLTAGRYPWPIRIAVQPLDGAAELTASTR